MTTIGLLGMNLSHRSGGVFNFVSGMIESAKGRTVMLKIIGTSHELRRYGDASYVAFSPQTLATFTGSARVAGAVSFFSLNMLSALCNVTTAVSLSHLVKRSYLNDVDGWFFPHCFLPFPEFDRTVVYCWDLQHYTYPRNFKESVRWLRRKAEESLSQMSRVICASHFTKMELLNRYPKLAQKTSVLYAVPHLPSIVEKANGSKDYLWGPSVKPLFIYPAVDWPHKNHATLLRAVSILKERIGSGFEVVLTGSRRHGRWLSHLIEQHRLTDVVRDAGVVSTAELISLYRRATALVFPSLYEGFGLPLSEAMLLGVPIIASRCTAVPEIVDGAALLCEPTSAEDFATSMLRIVEDEHLRVTLARASRARSRIFRWNNWWRNFDEILHSL